MRFFALALALVSSATFAAPSCTVSGLPSIAGKSYHVARGLLIDAGMIPQLTPTDPNLAPWVDDPRRLFGYGEVSDCSGSGTAACFYQWKTPSGKPFTVAALDQFHKVARVSCP